MQHDGASSVFIFVGTRAERFGSEREEATYGGADRDYS